MSPVSHYNLEITRSHCHRLSSPSSSLHLRPSLPLPPHPFTLLRHPALLLSDFFFSSSSCAETMFETWYCLSDSIRLAAVMGGPLLPTFHVSCQTLTSPMWDSSAPSSFLVSTFPIYFLLPFILSASSPPFTLSSHEPVRCHHRTVSEMRYDRHNPPSNSICATIIPHQV